jgi:transposase
MLSLDRVKKMINNFEKMIAGSLDLEEPWYVVNAEFKPEKEAMEITIDVRPTAEFVCPKCGGKTNRYGYEPNEREWRHGDCMFYPCYIKCRRPKVRCEHCGVQQINAPFERKNSSFTLYFEGYALMIMKHMPIANAAEILRCNEKSLTTILCYWVEKAVNEDDLSDVYALSIDETSFKKGHKYVTVVIDADERRVIDVESGKDKESVQKFAEKLEKKGGSKDKIEVVTSDMSTSFLPAIEENFPNAENIIDKFHVKQALNKALDDVRKNEQKTVSDKKTLFRGRRLFMIPQAKMSENQVEKLAEMSKLYPLTGRAYRIVSALDDFYDAPNYEQAKIAFDGLCSWMRRCRLEPMKATAKTLLNHKEKILNYFKNRFTNAVCEGVNSLIQAAKRKARGYHTLRTFSAIIYLVSGKLTLSVPTPF